ncbi:class I SAM-dependent methyltransferase [uncultured Jatrophihabitans sp.]|uniref:class I SAM-dependent methyltransferase n=1 Tax=uncultured Jatrophihabitans sp. TaxID=1610747 RepID=UPI0035CB945C
MLGLPAGLPLTGERTAPDVPAENYWFRRHQAAYAWAVQHARGRRVLEVGCGEGYGADTLAAVATRVVGVDYDALAVAHAARRYSRPRFVRANLAALPVRTGSVELVATLQVVEHVWHHGQFLRECRRVLAAGGLVLVTTPNRLTFSPGRETPLNPFHTVEFSAAELLDLLARCGLEASFVGGLHAGPRIAELDAAHGGSLVDAQLAAPPDEWPAALAAAVAAVRSEDFAVLDAAAHDVDLALDLVMLAAPAGAPDRRAAGFVG